MHSISSDINLCYIFVKDTSLWYTFLHAVPYYLWLRYRNGSSKFAWSRWSRSSPQFKTSSPMHHQLHISKHLVVKYGGHTAPDVGKLHYSYIKVLGWAFFWCTDWERHVIFIVNFFTSFRINLRWPRWASGCSSHIHGKLAIIFCFCVCAFFPFCFVYIALRLGLGLIHYHFRLDKSKHFDFNSHSHPFIEIPHLMSPTVIESVHVWDEINEVILVHTRDLNFFRRDDLTLSGFYCRSRKFLAFMMVSGYVNSW